MGWGKNPGRPLTDVEKLVILQEDLERYKEMATQQITELVEALFVKYQENPDKHSEKLLIMHLRSTFFERTKRKEVCNRAKLSEEE